jgi:hypothetical protein
MHTFMDAKLMAKLLRQALAERDVDVSHSDSLELVARQFGVANWNILSARIEAATAPADVGVPEGWLRSGQGSRYYLMGVEKRVDAAWIESRPGHAELIRDEDFCTMMQSVKALSFRGQRLRLQAQLRAENVIGGVTLWFRIDGPSGSLQFENLERYQSGGPLRGTTDWTERAIVLDVPETATVLNYGFYLKGTGRGWARCFAIDPVDAAVPVNMPEGWVLDRPRNLSLTSRA